MKGGGGFDYRYSGREIKKTSLADNLLVIDSIIDAICSNFEGKEKIHKKLDNSDIDKIISYEKTLLLAGSKIFYKSNPMFMIPEINDSETKEVEKLIRGLIVGHYIHNCLKVVRLNVTEEHRMAYTIFDSLNTTGKLLNAYESFKPEVISNVAENKGRIEKDLTKTIHGQLLEKIDSTINSTVKDHEKIDSHVEKLVITFALTVSGKKLSKNIVDQRRELKSKFLTINDNEKVNYIKLFLSVAEIYKLYFGMNERSLRFVLDDIDKTLNPNAALNTLIAEANFCLNYLNHAKCLMALAIISRYYHVAKETRNKDDIEKFCKVTTATAAVYALWRSSDNATQTIDSMFRKLFNHNDHPAAFYNFDKNEANKLPGYHDLINFYRNEFIEEKKITDCNSWIEAAKKVEFYSKSKATAKMIILTGSHNTIVEKNNGKYKLSKANKSSGMATITESSYYKVIYETIEHIIPQSESDEDPNFDRLWNLTLLPRNVNSSINDTKWEEKRDLYYLYSSATSNELKKRIKEISSDLSHIESKIANYLKEEGSLQMLELLSKEYNPKYDEKAAENRIKSVFTNSWSILANKWLEWPTINSNDSEKKQ